MENQQAQPKAFWENVVANLDKEIKTGTLKGLGITKQEKSIYIGYYKGGEKIMGINKSKNFKCFSHNAKAREIKVDGLEAITDKVAKQKHYGKVTAIYTGASLDIPTQLLKLYA